MLNKFERAMNRYKTIHLKIVIWRKISFICVTAIIIISSSLRVANGGSYQQRVLSTQRRVSYSESHPLARARHMYSITNNRESLDSLSEHDRSDNVDELSEGENPTTVMLAVYSTNATSESISYSSSTFQIEESNKSSSNSSLDTRNDTPLVASSISNVENVNNEDVIGSTQLLSQNDVTTIVDNDEVDKLLVHNQTDIDTLLTLPNDDINESINPSSNVSENEIQEFDQNIRNSSLVEINDTKIDQKSNNSQLNDEYYSPIVSEDPILEKDNNNLYQPIRISAVLTKETRQSLTEKQQKYLLDDVLSPALTAWSSALSVVPVIGNLVVDRAQLFDGISCGPGVDSGFPSPLVPEDHMENGIPNTDLVIYISISQFQKVPLDVIATAGVGSFKEDIFEEVEEIDDIFEDDENLHHVEDSSHSVDLFESDDYIYNDVNDNNRLNYTNGNNETNPILMENTNATNNELGMNHSNVTNSDIGGQPYLVHQRQKPSGKIIDVLGQVVTCNPNSTTILIDDIIYMQENHTYVMCQIHENEFYDHFDFIECTHSRYYPNETIYPNTTTLLPCDIDSNTTLIDSMTEGNSTLAFSLCYQVVSITNSTSMRYDLTPYSYLSCNPRSFNSNYTGMNISILTSNVTSWDSSNHSEKNESFFGIENEALNENGNETENDNNIENDQLNFIDEALPICPTSALASASYCSTDQFDRPVAGTLNYCINELFFSEENLQQNILATIHELAHILGLNSQSLAHFRDKFGFPLTPRDESGNVIEKKIRCTGVNEKEMSIPLPSENILKFRQVRDIIVADVVTPTVRQIARNQFDCQTLPGAELENGDINADVCIGNHWGRRVFRSDVLSPVLDDVPFSMRITPLTLAYFKDSGWYNIDVSRSSFGSSWGRGAGCSFVNNKCVDETGVINRNNEQFFCDQRRGRSNLLNEIHGCSSDYSKKAVCSLMDYEGSDEIIPEPYQYFGNNYGPQWGGIDPDLEYCPAFIGFSNGQCNDESNIELKVHSSESFGLQNSRCVYSEIGSQRTSLCLPLACVISDQTLLLKVDGKWRVCEYEGQKIELRGRNSDHVICPNPSRLCPSFYCPRNCLEFEGAVCNYTSGKCECPHDSELCHKSNVTTNLTAIGNDVKESAIYFANITALQKDSRNIFEETASAFEKMSLTEILYMLALIVVGLLAVGGVLYFILRHLDKKNQLKREANKEKMMATVVVDLRIRENDRRRLKKAFKRKERRKGKRYEQKHGLERRSKKQKRRLRRHPYQAEDDDHIILSINSFSTDSTAAVESTEGESTMCFVDDSTFDNCSEGDKMNEFDDEITADSEYRDFGFRNGSDGNIYCADPIDNEHIDQDFNTKKNDLRHRHRPNPFREDL